MTKTFKRFLALLMTVMLIFSVVPTTVFAAEVPPEPESTVSSEAPQEPEPTPLPEITPEPSQEPFQGPAPASAPEAAETVEPSPIPEPSAEPEDTELTPGTELNMDRIWPAIRRAQARAAANIGTSGTLYVGDYCFTSAVGVPPTLGEHIGLMPVETMRFGSNNVAAYCLEHSKESGDGMGYTWMDLTTNNQDTVGTILALGFQWNSPSNWAVPSDDSDKWIVTQVLIWEAIANHAFKQGNGLYGVESGVDADMQMISTHAHNPSKFMEYYRDLKKRLNDYLKVPSFASKEASKAETITLRWDGSKYSATVTDTNSVLRNFTFENKIPGVKITTRGNSMTLSATEPILSPKTSPAIHNNMAAAGGKGAVAVWRTADRDFQDFGTYNVDGGDPVMCYIKIKTDAVGSAGLVKTSEDGKVEGIQFQITGSDGSSTTKTTDASGNIDIEGLPIYAADGSKITYTVTEINVPNKYVKPQSQTFQLTEGQTASIRFENKLKRWRVTVSKSDEQTGSTSQGNGSLKGATFGVYQGDTLVKEYTVGDDNTFTTDYFPYGEDWTLKEISAGEGYKVNTVVTDLCEIPAGSNEEFNDNTATVTNEVIRGGVSVEKRDSKTGERPQGDADFSGIQFEIVNKSKNPVEVGGKKAAPDEVAMTITTNAQGVASTGPNVLPYGDYIIREKATNASMLKTFTEEIPVTVSENGKVYTFTAENGEVRTETKWNAHSLNTNGNDDKPEAEWDDETGTWFGLTTEDWMVETQDGLCALSYDYYTLQELRCEGNKGYALVTVPNIFISRDSTVIELGTIDDHEEGMPEIGTTATVDGEKTAEPLSEVTIVDTVRYSGLTVGKTYKLSGVLMDKATGEPLMIDGKQITAEKEFTPKSESGTEELSYTFNASALAGKSVVVFEDLFEGENKVASHADIEDEGQTVTFTEPKIGTTATANGEHTSEPVGDITIIDTVAYSGLIPGKEYTVKGVLMDKATGKPLTVNDKEITAEATFRASKAEGTIDIPFTFDASALAGKTVVAFETLYRDKLEVCAHTDIEDKDQTVTFSEKPEIKTTATVNGEKKVQPAGEVTITDTVTYTGLTPGKSYKLSGVLMDKASGAPILMDGQQVTAEKEFAPESVSGTEEITFTFDASALAGKSVVVYETLYHEGKEVAVHADINDLGQTVEFTTPDKPEIKTTAAVEGEKKAEPKGEVTITDTVSYTGLTPGKQYKISGVLMDKGTGEKLLVDGKEVASEKEFTPSNAAGTEEITFTFDASALAGKSVVVFETLFHDNKEVAVHADINDKDQTVEFEEPDKPHIKTKATVDGEKEVDPLEKITLTDTVTYSNLTPGKTYTVKGVLMEKSTGEKLLIDGEEVTAETEFTPDKSDGSVDLTFTFNASCLAGKSVVAFETLYNEGVEVAVHADIEDDDQTVVIRQPKLKTTATIGGKKEATISKELVLEDKVAYTGLTPDREYTVKGVLMDKSTGKKLLLDGKEVTAEATFTPEKPEGEVTVTFKFDASGFKGKTELVVFETLYRDGKEIAAHADINDDGQTVTLTPEGPKTPDVPKTGDDRNITLPLIMLGASLAGLAVLFLFRFRGKKRSPQTGSKKD